MNQKSKEQLKDILTELRNLEDLLKEQRMSILLIEERNRELIMEISTLLEPDEEDTF